MTIKENQFAVNRRDREFRAVFEVVGEARIDIQADTIEEARKKAKALLDEDGHLDLEMDEVTHARIDRLYKLAPMFLVTRDGQPMQVSRLEDGDQPRQPDESGF